MARTSPDRRGHRVAIVGGGVAAVEALLALRALAGDQVEIDLLAPEPWLWYRPLATVEASGGRPGRQHFELAAFARACDARFVLGATAVAVDVEQKVVYTVVGGSEADRLPYDSLLVATGARSRAAFSDAITFRGPADADAIRFMLDDVHGGRARRLVFAVPAGTSWPLPLYELAFRAAHRLGGRADITFVTPEQAPLELFGERASTFVERTFAELAIELRAGTTADRVVGGALQLASGARIGYDRLVALPRLEADPPAGLPHEAGRFLPIDQHARVVGTSDVWAAGDVTSFPIKQGGIAAQQADAAAEAIAARAGARIEPHPIRPVLRAVLVTGRRPVYLRYEPGVPDSSTVAHEPLWWPPAKIAGRYLAPFLAEHVRLTAADDPQRIHRPLVDVDAAP